MARVVVAQRARTDLDHLIRTRSLPPDTPARVQALLRQLTSFPSIGKRLAGRWHGLRVILGPWPWMLIVYVFDEGTDTVAIVAVHDARSASSATFAG
jgi:hypothetical protein